MEQRPLGRTGSRVSALGFGCGSVGGIFVRGAPDEQRAAFDEAIAAGVTYFDTAPGYGDGRSEENLGRVLAETRAPVVVGTKVRLQAADVANAAAAVRRSLETSLRRLRRDRINLLQLHNRVTGRSDARDGALSVEDVLGPVADALRAVTADGLVEHIGFTGLGETASIHQVIAAGVFETVQTYFNALNPSAGWAGRSGESAQDFAGLIDRAASTRTGVIVIRPLAAGALGGQDRRHPVAGDPGASLDAAGDYVTARDRARSTEALAESLGLEGPAELAIRFALAKAGVSTVLVGLSDRAQLHAALRWAERGPLDGAAVEMVLGLPR